uniref:Uncharacterized protein n=1 Tax=Rhizophora mucronata TaxID=61149 RepID=A0A2P2QVU6_RHIMU
MQGTQGTIGGLSMYPSL